MTNHSYCATIEVAQSPQHVFDRITDVSRWWSKDYEGRSARLHDEFVIHYPGRNYARQRLVDVVPGRRIEWLVTQSTLTWFRDPSEWTNTRMVFEITTNGDRTVLHFTHDGLVPGKECYAMCAQGWDRAIKESLFHIITAGQVS